MCDQQSLKPACAYAQSDQSLCLSLEYSMSVELLTEHHLVFLSLTEGCRGLSESTHLKMSHCRKSHVAAHILGQKINAACKTYIVYGGSFTHLSQTICHSLRADSWIMSSWGCPSYHCHRTKLIHQFKPTFIWILTSCH